MAGRNDSTEFLVKLDFSIPRETEERISNAISEVVVAELAGLDFQYTAKPIPIPEDPSIRDMFGRPPPRGLWVVPKGDL